MDTITLALISLAILVVVFFAAIQCAFCFLKPLILKLLPVILYFTAYFIVYNTPGKPALHSTLPPAKIIMWASQPFATLGFLIGWALYESVVKNRQ